MAKYKVLADRLRASFSKSPPGTRLPTEWELAETYQISRQTVRKALDMLYQDGLIERRQGSGTYLCQQPPKGSRNIAVITSFVDDYIFPVILHDVQTVFDENGYSPLIFATENQMHKERQILQRLLSENIAAVLVEGSKTALPNPNLDLYAKLSAQNIPVVFLHSAYTGLSGAICIADDNYGGGYTLTKYLYQKGHHTIAGIFKSDDIQGHERFRGYASALRDRGLDIIDAHCLWYDTDDRVQMIQDKNPAYLNQFIQTAFPRCTAVICYNDEIAYYLIRQLLAAGYQVPQDIAVVSFDNSYFSDLSEVRITSLAHRPERIGKIAAQKVVSLLAGKPARPIQAGWELVVKQSS